MGVLALLFAILVLCLLPYLVSPEVRSNDFRPLANFFFWLFVLDAFILGWVGSKPVEEPYVQIAQLATVYYFSYFLFFLPIISWLENNLFKKNK
jgi:quinol-cytochrome oxidoreductase complex cytochrome b subunit